MMWTKTKFLAAFLYLLLLVCPCHSLVLNVWSNGSTLGCNTLTCSDSSVACTIQQSSPDDGQTVLRSYQCLNDVREVTGQNEEEDTDNDEGFFATVKVEARKTDGGAVVDPETVILVNDGTLLKCDGLTCVRPAKKCHVVIETTKESAEEVSRITTCLAEDGVVLEQQKKEVTNTYSQSGFYIRIENVLVPAVKRVARKKPAVRKPARRTSFKSTEVPTIQSTEKPAIEREVIVTPKPEDIQIKDIEQPKASTAVVKSPEPNVKEQHEAEAKQQVQTTENPLKQDFVSNKFMCGDLECPDIAAFCVITKTTPSHDLAHIEYLMQCLDDSRKMILHLKEIIPNPHPTMSVEERTEKKRPTNKSKPLVCGSITCSDASDQCVIAHHSIPAFWKKIETSFQCLDKSGRVLQYQTKNEDSPNNRTFVNTCSRIYRNGYVSHMNASYSPSDGRVNHLPLGLSSLLKPVCSSILPPTRMINHPFPGRHRMSASCPSSHRHSLCHFPDLSVPEQTAPLPLPNCMQPLQHTPLPWTFSHHPRSIGRTPQINPHTHNVQLTASNCKSHCMHQSHQHSASNEYLGQSESPFIRTISWPKHRTVEPIAYQPSGCPQNQLLHV